MRGCQPNGCHGLGKEEKEIPCCDYCIHFLFYRTKEGHNLDGSGWCGLKREEVHAGYGCDDYYCKTQWRKDAVEGVA